MTTYIDIDLKKTDAGYYDIYFDDTGDFGKTAGFNTALKMSVFCERRASPGEVAITQKQRGWWGNAFNGYDNFEYGSKLWLLNQAKATQNTLNNSITFSSNAVEWLITDNHLINTNVVAAYSYVNDLVQTIDLIRSNNVVESVSYSVWNNTLLEVN